MTKPLEIPLYTGEFVAQLAAICNFKMAHVNHLGFFRETSETQCNSERDINYPADSILDKRKKNCEKPFKTLFSKKT